MSEREAFGPNLRRLRVQRGISLERIASATKVSADLWSGLEQNNFSRWPTGIYARAYVRAYAIEVGVDPDTTVDEFCRLFPNGDRRAERVVRKQAALVGHDLRWKDDLVGSVIDEKRASVPAGRVRSPARRVHPDRASRRRGGGRDGRCGRLDGNQNGAAAWMGRVDCGRRSDVSRRCRSSCSARRPPSGRSKRIWRTGTRRLRRAGKPEVSEAVAPVPKPLIRRGPAEVGRTLVTIGAMRFADLVGTSDAVARATAASRRSPCWLRF